MKRVRINGGLVVGNEAAGAVDLTIVGEHIQSLGFGRLGEGPTIDASGLSVAPGFVDIQINGGYGFDLLSDPGSMWELGALLTQQGVTSFLPTIITSAKASTDAALAAIASRPYGYVGAHPIGLHFEGPMLSAARKGAHPESFLTAPSLDVIEGWSADRGVRLVTIAPELTGALDVIEELVRRGVVVSCGHSEATADEAADAVSAGATAVTHLFNAMAPLTHRNPPLLALALAEPAIVAGIILDGIHVDPTVARVAWNAKGPEGIALISDAVAPMGCPAGTFEFGDRDIVSDGDCVRQADGALAGSMLTMDRAVRNAVAFTGCSIADAVRAATATPARLVGADDTGSIEPGGLADIVLLEPDLTVAATLCRGRLAYVAPTARHRIPVELT